MFLYKFKLERTKRGHPALWEKGGGYTSTGRAQIIARPDGAPAKPFYVRLRGELAGREHALLPVEVGSYVVSASHHRGDFVISVYRITAIDGNTATAELDYEFSQGEWDKEPPEFLQAAIEAAKKKAYCYHCRTPHYIQDDDE